MKHLVQKITSGHTTLEIVEDESGEILDSFDLIIYLMGIRAFCILDKHTYVSFDPTDKCLQEIRLSSQAQITDYGKEWCNRRKKLDWYATVRISAKDLMENNPVGVLPVFMYQVKRD